MNDDLGTRIAKSVIDTFNGLNVKSGKPVTRSNGVQEWTVLAGVVAILDDSEIKPITLATGVKTLPDKVRVYSKGLLVHDMHAEMLALRLFNYYLLEKDCPLVDTTDGVYKLRDNVKLALFVSEPPCGDVSMNHVASLKEENEPWVPRKKQKLNRGRNNFGELGIVRTKPGKSDSLISLSKSCSDKLCLKQLTGVCNAVVSTLFEQPIYLDYLVTKNIDQEDFNRCFRSRFDLPNVHYLTLLTYDYDEYGFEKSEDKTASPLSLLHLVPAKFTQVLNNGVKNGSYVKNKAPKPGGESVICNWNMVDKLGTIKDIAATDYTTLKQSNARRQELKTLGRDTLQDWTCTSEDDFEI
ncbi:tRNA-specific adenosine deaminase 1 [Candida viswanathii]|uniref:tRNA-specific adenosine deaminase 1 n=1 Tax=Candida viswanathii TaxID=5486 RepID=A0A367YJ02_9ASCO|nr:tRNA-specific adenosine deaminase 1 [Candida viswanathii]